MLGSRSAERAVAAADEIRSRLGGRAAVAGMSNAEAAATADTVFITGPFGSHEDFLKDIKAAVAGRIIVAHKRGYVVANAGVDQSNIRHDHERDGVLLLPKDPDASAQHLMSAFNRRFGVRVAIIINDSFGRAWRNGTVGTAIGAAGIPALIHLAGRRDLFQRPLQLSEHAFADEFAAAGSRLMGQADEAIPAVLVHGLKWTVPERPAAALVRAKDRDLFR